MPTATAGAAALVAPPAAPGVRPDAFLASIEQEQWCACAAPEGWTKALDKPEVWVCGKCGYPSLATTERMRKVHADDVAFRARVPELASAAASTMKHPEPASLGPEAALHARLEGLREAISSAASQQELTALWQANQDLWDDDLTRRVQQRLCSLMSATS